MAAPAGSMSCHEGGPASHDCCHPNTVSHCAKGSGRCRGWRTSSSHDCRAGACRVPSVGRRSSKVGYEGEGGFCRDRGRKDDCSETSPKQNKNRTEQEGKKRRIADADAVASKLEKKNAEKKNKDEPTIHRPPAALPHHRSLPTARASASTRVVRISWRLPSSLLQFSLLAGHCGIDRAGLSI